MPNPQAVAIIGAGWGDEGKGLMTDYFAAKTRNGLVCRTNGGAQAGHTVNHAKTRHVFSHYGSGTFRGLHTYLDKEFVFNPALLLKEHASLAKKNVPVPTMYVHPSCIVTTPFDVIVNHIAEESRGNARHGSCGAGIFETITRSANSVRITYDDLYKATARREYATTLRDTLQFIQRPIPARLVELGISDVAEKWVSIYTNPKLIDDFMAEVTNALRHTTSVNLDAMYLRREIKFDLLIFEGAQGLMLDRNNKEYFPHLTPSNTGLLNVLGFLDRAGLSASVELDVVYCTRAYATRHGEGKFPRHDATLAYADATNAPNPWQGSLRFGHLDLDILAKAINSDFNTIKYMFPDRFQLTNKGLAITCMDQVGDEVKFWTEDTLCEMDPAIMAEIAADMVGANLRYQSFGPIAKDVREI